MKILKQLFKTRMAYRMLVLVLAALFLLNVGIALRFRNRTYALNQKLESLNKELDNIFIRLNKNQHLPRPENRVIASIHDSGFENSWIQDIDRKEGLVLVATIDSKMTIVFKPAPDNLAKFNVGWLAPVTFQCSKYKKGKCDFKSPYKLFVSNGLVEVKQLTFPKK